MPSAARKTEAESGEERREKSEKAIGENAEKIAAATKAKRAAKKEKSGRVIITLFKQKRVRLLTKMRFVHAGCGVNLYPAYIITQIQYIAGIM